MGNMSRSQSSKAGIYSYIAGISIACAISVIGLSAAFLSAIGKNGYKGGPSNDATSSPNDMVVIAVAATIVGAGLQLISSIVLWCTKDKESKNLLFGFILGQGVIQVILIVCLVLVVYNHFKPPPHPPNLLTESSSKTHPLGHGFWIILVLNIAIHLAAVSYLINLVMKRNGYNEETEEMASVVVHRRIPSRIPKQKGLL